MPESGERYGGSERDLSLIRDRFVRGFLGEDASHEEIAKTIGMLVRYEQELINRGIIELHD